jgi:hypothetical protein
VSSVHASVHGLGVRYTFDGTDPLGGFFAPFAGARAGDDAMTVDIRRVERALPPRVDNGTWRPLFFYGRVQAYVGEEGLLLVNGSGVGRVSKNASSIQIETSGSDELTEGLFHVAMLWALRARGIYDLHAGAVVEPGGALLLFAGDSGVGKTTWTLAFVEAGAKYLGDDRVLLRGGDVLSYPRAFHLGPATLEAFARYEGGAAPLELEARARKRRVVPSVERLHEGGLSASVVFFPQIEDTERSETRALSKAEAFGRLLIASAIVAVDGMPRRDEQLANLRDLVVRTPCYELFGGRDLLREPAAVAQRIHAELRLP